MASRAPRLTVVNGEVAKGICQLKKGDSHVSDPLFACFLCRQPLFNGLDAP